MASAFHIRIARTRHPEISVTRYEDGLTLDALSQSVGAVFKTELSAVWVVQQHLAEKNDGFGDRFDFKRLGF